MRIEYFKSNVLKFQFLLSFSFFSFFADFTSAQGYVGLKAGLNYSSFYGDKWKPLDDENYGSYQPIENKYRSNPRFLWTVGGVMKFPINEIWTIQPECIYSAKGDKIIQQRIISKNNLKILNEFSYKIKLHYFEIPILLRYQLRQRLDLLGGLRFSYLMRSKSKSENIFQYYDNSSGEMILEEKFSNITSTEIKDIKRFDPGIAAGIGYKVDSCINIGIRASMGANRIYKDEHKYKNLDFQLTVSYFIK